MLDIFALIVLLILVSAGIALAVFVGGYPGKVARAKNHPQADAINYMGWFGLISFGVLWIAALIWAQVNYSASQVQTHQKAS